MAEPTDADLLKEALERVGAIARARIAELEVALAESVRLQSHYAALLNDYDAGSRLIFDSPEAWIARLRKTGTLPDG